MLGKSSLSKLIFLVLTKTKQNKLSFLTHHYKHKIDKINIYHSLSLQNLWVIDFLLTLCLQMNSEHLGICQIPPLMLFS